MAFVTLDQQGTVEPFSGYVGKMLHSEHMTVANWEIMANSPFPEHSHSHEQISIVTEGEFEMTVDGETEVLRPGIVALIPSDAKHSGRALTNCKVIDVFHPVREDYK